MFTKFTKTTDRLNMQVVKLLFTTMTQPLYKFRGQSDRYDGITVDSKLEPCEAEIFSKRLEVSLDQWIKDKRRTVWFQVDLSQSYWIPELIKRGFKFHHAKEDRAMLYRWLSNIEMSNVPPYAHTNIGVGAVVLNDKTKEILVVKDKHGISTSNWKLPGGYIELEEDIAHAAEREVVEETGVIAKFKCLLAIRHTHYSTFGCSDIYTICCLVPQTFNIVKCHREISECQWMKLEEFITHPHVHSNNRLLASKIMEYINHRMGLTVTKAIHPLTKKPLCIFSISDTNDS
ncbi:PREDICTED: nucleoside diphosphate-linked moiety X motif 6 [Ceratosolen solmsi marchali]|uniref:Nucleoside diphosphate-linked moiety X motif 6 n=1 Tax=Ceratosolen solmsi marchali TaxID=326594 RepID=A0AAJ6YBW0_9HYME|nr:PREDICTED: nucleoside diphosphate-linked moiety X motif 6 [Ceratosolen solmsi marchali]